MALPVWPVTLPTRPLREGNKRGPRRGPIVTEMEDGPDVMRRATRIVSRKESVAYDLTPTQMTAFETFYDVTLNGGVLRFTMPTVDAAGTVTDRTTSILPKQDTPYDSSWTGGAWKVSFDIVVYS